MRRHRGGCGRDEYDGRILSAVSESVDEYLRHIKDNENSSKINPHCAKSKIPDLPCTTLRPRGESYLRILLQSVAAWNCGREGGKTQNKAERMKRARAKRPEHKTNPPRPQCCAAGADTFTGKRAACGRIPDLLDLHVAGFDPAGTPHARVDSKSYCGRRYEVQSDDLGHENGTVRRAAHSGVSRYRSH